MFVTVSLTGDGILPDTSSVALEKSTSQARAKTGKIKPVKQQILFIDV
jgi:hypothetical protein